MLDPHPEALTIQDKLQATTYLLHLGAEHLYLPTSQPWHIDILYRHIYIYIHKCVYVLIYVYTSYTCMQTCIHTYIWMCMFTYTHVHAFPKLLHTYIYVYYISIYIYIHTRIHTYVSRKHVHYFRNIHANICVCNDGAFRQLYTQTRKWRASSLYPKTRKGMVGEGWRISNLCASTASTPVHICIYIYIYVCIYIYTYISSCILQAYAYLYKFVHLGSLCTRTHTDMCMYMYIGISCDIHASTCVCNRRATMQLHTQCKLEPWKGLMGG